MKTKSRNKYNIGTTLLGIFVAIVVISFFYNLINTIKQPDTGTIDDLAGTDKNNGQTTSVYIVKKGDTLWKIAENQFGSGEYWKSIVSENMIANPDRIEEGKTLKLPLLKQVPTSNPTISSANDLKTENNSQLETKYTVVRGDCLWTIAVQNYGDGTKWIEIAEKNKLANPDIIHAGNVLELP